ncbi:hypothetical protein BT96DRAFT_832632 [Gymnopus androsaceus JB14]|uniref:alpha-1,6-mannosyl-glycoprotein 6-beta-N-acetylglucosaminyltransferase n=1 Tax=Gymnopus androsaceus JB14 TaxID=1447944 RepID=A0A6A4H124_9AGAR|nr:hypothetical protein BT96DRAFT_832632 [Gymnopus androsaceus JB14]
MRALIECMSNANCTANQTSIVILSSFHFATAICEDCRKAGEDIWYLYSLREMGYTTLFAPSGNKELVLMYRQFPDLVKIIIMEGTAAHACFVDPDCIKTPKSPLGIPAWKMLSLHFWGGSAHPLGNSWTLSPENYSRISSGDSKDNVYLGYSIERTCLNTPITPISERPQRAYVLSKKVSYFSKDNYAWSKVSLIPPFHLTLVAGMINDTEHESSVTASIVNLGLMNQVEFYRELGQSRALIGIGSPWLSPTPYDALCMGVPFINPILKWDRNDPDNRDNWLAQHNGLKYELPPYVYNVKRDDTEGLWSAVRAALDNPIERYIVPAMTMESLKSRVAFVVEKDWKSQAEELLAERISSGSDEVRAFID